MLKIRFVFALLILLTSQVVWSYPAAGGSNYAWYNIASCNREPYGVVANYNTAQSTIDAQLQSMFNAGQRRLRIPIYFGHGLNTGTVMDSSTGDLSTQNRTNLTNLLAKIQQIGYSEVEISFHAQGQNAVEGNLTDWSTWNEPLFQETWNLIYNLHSIFANLGITYRIDLYNEGIPSPNSSNYSVMLAFTQKLWNYYVYTFGKSDTLGFSIIPDYARIYQLDDVYGNSAFGNHGLPYLFDVHFYDYAYNTFVATRNNMAALLGSGNVPGWIIGEAYYNDATEAQALSSAISATGQTVYYLAQWPWDLSAGSCTGGVNIAPPTSTINYQNYGF